MKWQKLLPEMEKQKVMTVRTEKVGKENEKMNAFDKVIGYETTKQELLQICDMIQNKKYYEELGAKLPQGILLYGDPGMGKTLLAKCFIEESGLPSYLIRRTKSSEDFLDEITTIFQKAKENAPSIVFLDDLDKFENEDYAHCDAEAYVAIQAAIDSVNGKEVFVLATANDLYKLPESLRRAGRFDRKIELLCPSEQDACDIIKHYLNGKRVSEDVRLEDIAMMITYSSCAELETVLNEGAVRAAYLRHESITMEDLVEAVLKKEYKAQDNLTQISEEEMQRIALHEAGHLVVSEVLSPGSIGFASIRTKGHDSSGGFTRRCKKLTNIPSQILIALGGKAAEELYYADRYMDGSKNDISKAVEYIRDAICEQAACGVGLLDVETRSTPCMSDNLNARNEAVVQAELHRYLLEARSILFQNKKFLGKVKSTLLEKETLLYSDIRMIKESI